MSFKSPFLCSIIIFSFYPYSWYLFVPKILLNISVVCLPDSSPPSFMTSLVRLYTPGALLFLIFFRVFLTSDVMIGGTSGVSELVLFVGGIGLGV